MIVLNPISNRADWSGAIYVIDSATGAHSHTVSGGTSSDGSHKHTINSVTEPVGSGENFSVVDGLVLGTVYVKL